MKSVLEKTTRDELISRIKLLNENSARQWGKMTVSQMIKHCAQWDDMALGKLEYKQSLMGRLFGRMALKDMMKDEPMKKDLPTVPSFRIKEDSDFNEQKDKWLKGLEAYQSISDDGFVHPFFGKLSKEQTGYMVYKHADHHLRQFNV